MRFGLITRVAVSYSDPTSHSTSYTLRPRSVRTAAAFSPCINSLLSREPDLLYAAYNPDIYIPNIGLHRVLQLRALYSSAVRSSAYNSIVLY
jgi:hypothetical protein